MAGLVRLADLESLLVRNCAELTGEGLKDVCKLKNLRKLNVWGTSVGKRMVVSILDLPSLKEVWIGQTNISKAEFLEIDQEFQSRKIEVFRDLDD